MSDNTQHTVYKYYRGGNINWDVAARGGYVGGKFNIKNLSGGYHDILRQWWEHYSEASGNWMLVSETNSAKQQFCDLYPGRHFTTVDYYSDDVDLKLDLCAKWPSDFDQQYDAIVCQATFEHLYDPVTALKNLTTSLKGGGYLFLHTVIPGFVYHRCPEDYFRFFPDWFLASERFCDQVTVTELVTVNTHIFAAYLKCQTTQSS